MTEEVTAVAVANILISLGGLGTAVYVASLLAEIKTALKILIKDVDDHEDRLRVVERTRHGVAVKTN